MCADVKGNSACLRLHNIFAHRDDTYEIENTGIRVDELDPDRLPPCIAERGGFMAPFSVLRTINHPYSQTSKAHQHFAPTPVEIPPFTAGSVPFRWMLLESAREIAGDRDLLFREEAEAEVRQVMSFNSNWVQDVDNQRVLLDAFFSSVIPDESLVFFYAKEVPFVEDGRRVLVGVGQVADVGHAVEYDYVDDGPTRSLIWERNVAHSIRPEGRKGFLLPYGDALQRAQADLDFDPASAAVFVSDEQRAEFSYATEHVTHDAAIAVLLGCIEGLERSNDLLDTDVDAQLRWAGKRLAELWRFRGPFPGLGAALHAFGVDHANLFAFRLSARLDASFNPWPAVQETLDDPASLGPEWASRLGTTPGRKLRALPLERRALLELIARFDLTNDQAERFYVQERRNDNGIDRSDADLLANPYLLYEADRLREDSIPVLTIDRGVLPPPDVMGASPIPPPSALTDPLDRRRVRALVANVLEGESQAGHTVIPQGDAVLRVRDLPIAPPCPVDGDLLAMFADEELGPILLRRSLQNGDPALQLDRYVQSKYAIEQEIRKRVERGKRHTVTADWGVALQDLLGPVEDEEERRAREEKLAGLAELAAARFSLLIGPAGTGKTTLLGVLCAAPEIASGGVLLLAPTGKARVQLERALDGTPARDLRARTIAQFLIRSGRYDARTGRYRRSSEAAVSNWGTVIIDEASMLTEEQLDSVLDALQGVQRLILVGDPRQLPPIGAGRPFVDIISYLEPNVAAAFPKVGASLIELTVFRRQEGQNRDDLAIAEWFGSDAPSPLADEVWSRLLLGELSETIRLIEWSDGSDLDGLVRRVLAEEIDTIEHVDDLGGFALSLGGQPAKSGRVFHWASRGGSPGAGVGAEQWQLLSPVRADHHGTVELNRSIQRHFRSEAIQLAKLPAYQRKTPKPMGREGIVYGDKVINVRNHRHKDVWPDGSAAYVANGEIGMVVGQWKGKATGNKPPWKLQVEFSIQPGFSYGYGTGLLPTDGDSILELAYAITVHKAQGSEFGTTILVLPNPCRMLSRELIYTAMTRQRRKVVILHQGPIGEILAYSSDRHSDTAARLTNLLADPNPRKVEGRFLEDRLIHRTCDGLLVRSKSEVVIADLLSTHRVDFAYERPFLGSDNNHRFPDFTIEDSATGEVYLWEHLGMLVVPSYARAWDRKKAWYAAQGVLPIESGGGPAGSLIVTTDDERGGIDSQAIDEMIRTRLV